MPELATTEHAAGTPSSAATAGPSTLAKTAKDLSSVDPFAARLAHWLDSAFRVPGTNLRFGLDPILGMVAPGLGDVASGGLGTYLFFVALRRGVPLAIIARMAVNVLVDTVAGSIPLLGDLFDFAWKANDKNIALIKEHAGKRGPAGPLDYLIVLLVSALVIGAVLAPLILAAMLGLGVFSLAR